MSEDLESSITASEDSDSEDFVDDSSERQSRHSSSSSTQDGTQIASDTVPKSFRSNQVIPGTVLKNEDVIVEEVFSLMKRTVQAEKCKHDFRYLLLTKSYV
jgi:hypothetical protein